MKRQAIEKTIKRVGAAEYANALFYETERLWAPNDFFALGAFAEQKGRYRTAAKLYVRSIRHPMTGRRAVRRLLALSITGLKNFVRRSLLNFAVQSQRTKVCLCRLKRLVFTP